MAKLKVLVTGGAGFIGSHLVPALVRAGHQVRVLDPLSPQIHGDLPGDLPWLSGENVEFFRGSVLDDNDLKASVNGVDAIVHLAAETGTGQSMYEISRYNEVNTLGTAKLLDHIANDPERTVRHIALASSRSVYGEGAYVCTHCSPTERVCPEARKAEDLAASRWEPLCTSCGAGLTAVPTRETDRINPASIYAATKYAQEDLVRIACSSIGIRHSILRLQNVYGEGQSLKNPYTGILSIFSTRIRRGLDLPIFEDGLETRDFVHVDDVANAFVAALSAQATQHSVFNVGSGIATPVIDVARMLNSSFKGSSNIVVTGEYRIGDIRHNSADIAALTDDLGYSPMVDLQTGLDRFAAWVLGQPLPQDLLEKANAELRERNLMGQKSG
jgi:dTDP-L-rhamnose 4-epimerase